MFRKCDICKRETDITYEYYPHDDVCVTCCDEMDKEIFTEYLITNLKLYFDKFEDELKSTVEEPTSQSYQQQA